MTHRTGSGTIAPGPSTWLAGGLGSLLALSGSARAHGVPSTDGGSVGLVVLLGLPVATGLLGGVVALRLGRTSAAATGSGPAPGLLGLLVAVLGGTAAVAALAAAPVSGLLGGVVGASLASRWTGRRCGGEGVRGHHDHLTLGGVGLHRLVEGLALGTLTVAGTAVGTVGVLVVAGHAALETAAVGGLFAARPFRAVGATVLVQAGYVVGAGAGLGLGVALPAAVRSPSLGLVGGVLLVVGAQAWVHRPAAGGDGRARPEARP